MAIHIAPYEGWNYELVYGNGSVYVFKVSRKLVNRMPILVYVFSGFKLSHVRNLFPPRKQWDMKKEDIPRALQTQIDEHYGTPCPD